MYDQLDGALPARGQRRELAGRYSRDKHLALHGSLAATAQHTSCNVYRMARFSPSPTIGIGCLAAAKGTVVEEPPGERAAASAWDDWARPRWGSTALLLRWAKSASPGWARWRTSRSCALGFGGVGRSVCGTLGGRLLWKDGAVLAVAAPESSGSRRRQDRESSRQLAEWPYGIHQIARDCGPDRWSCKLESPSDLASVWAAAPGHCGH